MCVVVQLTASGTWLYSATLTAPTAVRGGAFGSSISFNGSLASVGGPGYETTGAVFVYQYR